MAKILKLVDNYVIFEQDGAPTGEYAINKSVYREEAETFFIKETIDQGELVIRKSDVDLGTIWFKSDGVTPFNVSDLRDFLRKNTGFKTASGGSEAIGAKVLKTNQTVSYRTGDDGDFEAGRATDFLTLANANPFGSTARFTDELGGSTYANDIVIDWSTYDVKFGEVLGYYRTPLSSAIWANQIDASLVLSIGTFTNGWRLTNHNEFSNIYSMGDNVFAGRFDGLNYAPFNINIGNYVWTSTSRDATFAIAHLLNSFGNFSVILSNKGNSYPAIACRTFTVTGTTLT